MTEDEWHKRDNAYVMIAYFADYAMMYPSLRPLGPPPEEYRPFLSAELLRQFIAFNFKD